jgi:hypothetical protein
MINKFALTLLLISSTSFSQDGTPTLFIAASCSEMGFEQKLKDQALAYCQDTLDGTSIDQIETRYEKADVYTDQCSDDGSYQEVEVTLGRIDFICL